MIAVSVLRVVTEFCIVIAIDVVCDAWNFLWADSTVAAATAAIVFIMACCEIGVA